MCFVMCRLKATWMQSTQYAYYIALFVFLYYMIVHFDCISIDLEITTHRPREVYEQFWLRRIRHLVLWHLPLFLVLCWNQISDYHIVLKPYNLTFWQSTPLHYTDVLSWLTTFHRVVNEIFFSVPVERHILLKRLKVITWFTWPCDDVMINNFEMVGRSQLLDTQIAKWDHTRFAK